MKFRWLAVALLSVTTLSSCSDTVVPLEVEILRVNVASLPDPLYRENLFDHLELSEDELELLDASTGLGALDEAFQLTDSGTWILFVRSHLLSPPENGRIVSTVEIAEVLGDPYEDLHLQTKRLIEPAYRRFFPLIDGKLQMSSGTSHSYTTTTFTKPAKTPGDINPAVTTPENNDPIFDTPATATDP